MSMAADSLALLAVTLLVSSLHLGGRSQLFAPQTKSCSACPGDILTYTCTTVGAGATIWTGTAFDCPSTYNEIILRHSQFIFGRAFGDCNSGSIVGRSLRVENNRFTSQLNVTVGLTNLNGRTVECLHDDGNGLTIIGTSTLTVVSAPYPPPDDVHVVDMSSGHVTFNWTSVDPSCSSIHYQIFIQNCGICPSSTTHTTVTCSHLQLLANTATECTFSVRTVVCGIVGNASNPVVIKLSARSPTFTEHPANLTVTMGATFNLSCTAIGMPDPTIMLLKDGRPPLSFTFNEISNGVYQFINADDTFHSGTYICNASNANGYTLSYPATITVRLSPPEPLDVQTFCSHVVWRNPSDLPCNYVSGYDVRLVNSVTNQDVIRRVDTLATFYKLGYDDESYAKDSTSVQVRLVSTDHNGPFSPLTSLGCQPPKPSVYLELRGEVLTNNSVINMADIGTGENALLCRTDKESCCGTPPNRAGEFYYPNGVQVPIRAAGQGFYRDRRAQHIRLNRRPGMNSPTGIFRCEIPDASGVKRKLFITLTNSGPQ